MTVSGVWMEDIYFKCDLLKDKADNPQGGTNSKWKSGLGDNRVHQTRAKS